MFKSTIHHNLRVLLFLFFCLIAQAQDPYAYTLNQNHGLKSLSIYDIFQDKTGFMWFATGKGLCRYDGTHFDYFTTKEQSLKSGSCIKEDIYGRIWYSNFDGFLFYVENQQLKEFPQKNQSGFKNFATIGEHLYLPQGNQIEVYHLKDFRLIKVIPLNQQIIKFALQVGDDYFVLTNQMFKIGLDFKITSFQFTDYTETDFIAPMICKFKNDLYVISKFNQKYYLLKNNRFELLSSKIPVEFVQNTGKDVQSIWLCSPKGVVKWEPLTNTSESFFQNINVTCVFQDRNKNYWIGTQNHGILWITNFQDRLIPTPSVPINLQSDEKNIWVGTLNDALYQWNQQTKQMELWNQSDVNHAINSILVDTLEYKILYNSSKLNVVDSQTKQKIYEKVIAIKDLCKLDEKYYAFAASGYVGLLTLKPHLSSIWDRTKFLNNIPQPNSSVQIHQLLGDSNGKSIAKINETTLYVATNNGLFKITPQKIDEVTFQNKPLYLTNIKYLHNKIIGLGTNDLLYEIENNKVKFWKDANLWMENNSQKMVVKNNQLFISDQKNWWKFDFMQNQFEKIFATVGDIEVTDVLPFNNAFIFATNKGIIEKNKLDNSNKVHPKLLIQNILLDDDLISESSNFSVPYQNEIIQIGYSIIYFSPGNQPKLQYRLNQGKWLTTPFQSKYISLNSLASGKYQLEMMAQGFPETKKIISFEILKPWWKSYWFILYIILLLSFVIWKIYRYQIQKIQRENLRVLEKVELEKNLNYSSLKAIKSQMNPHFFYNALNTIQSYILSDDKKQALGYLAKFSNLTRTILEMSEKEWISIAEEIKTLTLYLEIEKGRFDSDFTFQISTHQIPDTELQKIPTMLLQPYVENAVKHGLLHKSGEKALEISFTNQSPYLIVKIEDNGIGRKKSIELNQIKNKKHQSFATKAMENRIELLNKNYKSLPISVTFEDKINAAGVSQGTIVWIHIPIFTD